MPKLAAILLLTAISLLSRASAAGTLIPLAPGMQMTCQFVNNTGGEHADSDIWVMAIVRNAAGQFCHVRPDGSLVPCVPGQSTLGYFVSLASMNGMQWPAHMSSGRLYVAYGGPLDMMVNTAADGSVGIAFPNTQNPSDPSTDRDFDWIEFAVLNNAIWCNTTQVDMFGIPLKLELFQGSADSYTRWGAVGVTLSAAAIRAAWAAEVPPEFQGLMDARRIEAPIHSELARNGYFDAYIEQVWQQYRGMDLVIPTATGVYTGRVGSDDRLAFRRPGDANTYYVSKPSTFDVWGGAGALATGNWAELMLEAKICAGFHRHVIHDAAKLDDPAAYYKAAPADFYAKFWHDHNLGGMAYGFCYDDVNDQSSTLSCASPRGIILTIGGQDPATPTRTRTPQATPSRSPTRTRTATPSATPSATATATASATPSASASASASRTRSLTPSATASATASATGSPTPSPSASVSSSPTPSASPSASPSPTTSPTTSPSPTPSPTLSASVTPSASPSAARTPSATASATASATPSSTPSRSPTASSSATPSAEASPSSTALPTAQASPSPTATLSPGPNPARVEAADDAGRPAVLAVVPVPNPIRRGRSLVKVELGRALPALEWRVYSPARILLDQGQAGPWPAGHNELWLDSRAWPTGPLHLLVQAPGQGAGARKHRLLYLAP